jgi:hypothetical protein
MEMGRRIPSIATDTQGEFLDAAFIQVNYDPALVGNPSTVAQVAVPPWITNPNRSGADLLTWKTAFDGLSAFQASNPGTGLSSTVTFTALAPGVAEFILGAGAPFFFDFGTAAPGASASVTIVPEPTTAVLLALGLVPLGLRSRSR